METKTRSLWKVGSSLFGVRHEVYVHMKKRLAALVPFKEVRARSRKEGCLFSQFQIDLRCLSMRLQLKRSKDALPLLWRTDPLRLERKEKTHVIWQQKGAL